ncbi:MAG: gluconate 2-dehydrogenase gamma chain [Rhodothermales bacterium]|jgi:gluconate 2-dehydrogenase gamma chain
MPSTPLDRRRFLQSLGTGLGLALSPATIGAVLSGCSPNETGLRFLKPGQAHLVGELCEAIIPATDSPGAREAGVVEFIDMLLQEFESDEGRTHLADQLAVVHRWISQQGAGSMAELSPEQRSDYIAALDAQAFPRAGDMPSPFDLPPADPALFLSLKQWTVAGYYTSQVGAQVELRQNPMGVYRGDIPLREVGKTWA